MYVPQVANGMSFLHDRRPSPVLHGDLKTSNILLEEDGKRLVICDFGLSGFMNNPSAPMQQGALTVTISPPEVLKDPTRHRTVAADVYAFSVVLLEIMVGRPAYMGMKASAIRKMVCEGRRLPVPELVPPEVKCVIEECWAQEPEARPTFRDVLSRLEAFLGLMDEQRQADTSGLPATMAGAAQGGEDETQLAVAVPTHLPWAQTATQVDTL